MRIDSKNKIFALDKIDSPEVFFPDYVKDYLSKYVDYLRDIQCPEDKVNKIEKFAKDIYCCLREYYFGQHESSLFYFRRAIQSIHFDAFYRKVSADTFYRARTNKEATLYQADEMFHICFEKRHLVKTQRYSYPGLPCLYLGSTVEVCCEELDCRDHNLNIAEIRKNTATDICVFDLYFFENYDFNNLSDEEESRFVELWPLVACCSFRYKDTSEMSFRPDYIIPQLLLEIIVDKVAEEHLHGNDIEVHGIRYHSVRKPLLHHVSDKEKSVYINYVFPVNSCEPTGFCEELQSLFRVERIFKLEEYTP